MIHHLEYRLVDAVVLFFFPSLASMAVHGALGGRALKYLNDLTGLSTIHSPVATDHGPGRRAGRQAGGRAGGHGLYRY